MRRSQSAATTPSFEQWEEGFAALQKFHQREGHCRVLGGNREFGLNLGSWVENQRARKKGLTPDQIKRLDNLGFSWDPIAEQWEEGFAALQKFRKREGHCRVPRGSQEFGLNLGSWVGTQRSQKKRLTPDQIKRLDSLGFSWDPHGEQWEEGFAALQKFHQREGHCRVLGGNREFGLNSPSGRVLREDVHERNIAMRLWGHSSPWATGIENKVTTSALRLGPHLIPMRVQDETNTGFLQAPACGRFYISPADHVLGCVWEMKVRV
jgi:hypothetical protein